MQPAQIVLPVSVMDDGTPSAIGYNVVYDRFQETPDRTVYVRTGSAGASMRRQLTLQRQLPVRNGNFRGVFKNTLKLTRDVAVPGADGTNVVAPIVIEINTSIPVGARGTSVVDEGNPANPVSPVALSLGELIALLRGTVGNDEWDFVGTDSGTTLVKGPAARLILDQSI